MDQLWQCLELATMNTNLNPLDYHVWSFTKAMMYTCKVNITDEVLRQILNAATRKNNAAVLRKITCSLVTQVGKCIQAHGGHFEQLARTVNHITVTVQLTTIFNKHTMYFFLFHFQFTVNTRSSVTTANQTPVYMTLLIQHYLWN
jgi:hypothetical protein